MTNDDLERVKNGRRRTGESEKVDNGSIREKNKRNERKRLTGGRGRAEGRERRKEFQRPND